MEIVHGALTEWDQKRSRVALPVDRQTLAKRRWRGIADDGREFGFDLEQPLADGATIFQTDDALYCVAQKYEPVLEIGNGSSADGVRLGWLIGNLHFTLELAGDVVRVVDDPALRQLFEREGISSTACKRVFHPLSVGHHH